MVPALYYAFTVLDFDIVTRMHLSVGTSLAIIIPTSIISTKTHMEYDVVDFKMVKSFGIFILIGVFLGSFLAVNLKTPALVLFFSIFSFIVGLFFIFLREKLVENPKKISEIVKNISGIVIGFISVPLGIGGGSLMVPFMRTFGYDIRKSIGTAAAIGFLISLSGTKKLGLILTAVALLIGGIVLLSTNPANLNSVIYIGLAGLFLGYFYTAPHLRLVAKKGLGELTIFLAFGPLITLGTAFAIFNGDLSSVDHNHLMNQIGDLIYLLLLFLLALTNLLLQ